MENYIVSDHDELLKEIQKLDENIGQVINEFLTNFGTVISVGGSVTGVIMGVVGTNAVRVGAVEVLTYTTGAVVGWTLAIGMGIFGLIVVPLLGHFNYEDEA